MTDELPTIWEMLDKHPEIEYIRLLWIWEEDISDSHFVRVKNCLPARPIYKIDKLDVEYSYVGPYISDEDKAAFREWVDAYESDDRFNDLYVDDVLIMGNGGDYGLKITCLCGEIREYAEGWGEGYTPNFNFDDVYTYGGQDKWYGMYGVFDENTHTILSDRRRAINEGHTRPYRSCPVPIQRQLFGGRYPLCREDARCRSGDCPGCPDIPLGQA